MTLGLLSGFLGSRIYGTTTDWHRESGVVDLENKWEECRKKYSEEYPDVLECRTQYSKLYPDVLDVTQTIAKLTKTCPTIQQLLMKITYEDNHRTHGIFETIIQILQILNQNKVPSNILNILLEIIQSAELSTSSNIQSIKFHIPSKLSSWAGPHLDALDKIIDLLNTNNEIGIALKHICESELKQESFENWKSNQFEHSSHGSITDIKNQLNSRNIKNQLNSHKQSRAKISNQETSEECSR
ncbi:MAG: hypothetical protein LBH08_03255 [Puniceicoccales bacterium]|nr:hypothetical protein [Puniceicoccales bacterium]